MIVTCPQCQTRFRIPDEKVTAKGVKVRCTRCRHTFRVSRPAEPVPETAQDPFAQFAPPDALSEQDKTPPRGTAVVGADSGVEVEPAAAPPADDFDVDVETPEAKRAARGPDVEAWHFAPPPPRPPQPEEVPLRPAPAGEAAEPAEEEVDDATPRIALARIAMVRQLTVVPPPERSGAEALVLEASPDDRLELERGSPHSAWQGSTEGGLELPPSPDSAEFDFGDLNTLDGPSPSVAPTRGTPPPAPPVTAASPPPSPPGSLDFDELLGPPPPTFSGSTDLAEAAADSFGDFGPPAPPEARAASASPSLSLAELDFAPPPAAASAPDGRTPTGELFGRSATRLDEDSFPVGADPAADRAALFDMPGSPLTQEGAAPTSLLADVPDAAPEPMQHPAAGLPPVPPTPMGRISRPPTGTSVLGLEERREFGAARRVSGAVINITVAAVLVVVLAAVGNVYVNEGRLDWAALSPSRWAALFVPPTGIVTLDVSNGLYETRGGRPLAYVRGRVENRGRAPGQVKVRAEIWNGSQLLGTSEGLAGVLPSPEEMVEASTRRDVEALRARLQEGAPAVSPGKGADFVLLFDEPPMEVAGLRLKVTAAATDGK